MGLPPEPQKHIADIAIATNRFPEPFGIRISSLIKLERTGIGDLFASFIHDSQIHERGAVLQLECLEDFPEKDFIVELFERKRVGDEFDIAQALHQETIDVLGVFLHQFLQVLLGLQPVG